jgi:hypothetical protein
MRGRIDLTEKCEMQETRPRVDPFKRSFLVYDIKSALSTFGVVTNLFYTDNYFIAGTACNEK